MSRTTQWVRTAWSPACKMNPVSTKDAYTALDRCFKKWNYRPKSGQTWGYNCRKITGGTGYSLHAYDPGEFFTFWSGVRVTTAVATDINSLTNPYGKRLVTDMPRAMIDAITGIRTVGGLQVWRWGGYYSNNKDAMHFELIVSPDELQRGIDWSTVPGEQEDDLPYTEEQLRKFIKEESAAAVSERFGKRPEYAESTLEKLLVRGFTDASGQKVYNEEVHDAFLLLVALCEKNGIDPATVVRMPPSGGDG